MIIIIIIATTIIYNNKNIQLEMYEIDIDNEVSA
jgi:hypothetical protein